jgi:hypothetical protein
MPDTFDLNCCILGDYNPRRVFTVEIANNKTVSILQEIIKNKNKYAFEHVDADTLVLWKVSIPVDDNFKDSFNKHNFVEKRALVPVDRLSKVFASVPEEGHLHIVVKAPPIGACM